MIFNTLLKPHLQNRSTNRAKPSNSTHYNPYNPISVLSLCCASLLIFISIAPTPINAQLNIQQAVIPQISDTLGNMGVVGKYEGISKYQFVGQTTEQVLNNTFYDSIVAQADGQFYTTLNTSNGLVHSSCQMNDLLFLQGNFTTFGSAHTPQGLALFNMTQTQVYALNASELFQQGGSISTLYCHEPANQLFVGGDFQYKNAAGVAVFDLTSQEWSVPEFGGFPNGSVVNAIIATDSSSANSSIVFGGRFSGLANDSLVSNISFQDPSIVETQRISFTSAQISAEGSVENGLDPRVITCPSGQASNWKMAPNRAGSWTSKWPIYVNPTSLRLYNLDDGDNGVSIFRVLSFPSNSIMNLTYVNQTTQQEMYCDAWCPLPKSSEQKYVDFTFVNVIGTNTIQIELLDFYGSYAGLSGIEMFQSDSFTFANNTYNHQGTCKEDRTSVSLANSELHGDFKLPNAAYATYVTSEITDAAKAVDTSVVYQPNVTVDGNYTLMLFTPGCIQDGTCSTRGGVNVTVQPSLNADPIYITLYQTNDYDKYDIIYNGTMQKMTSNFRPSVTVTPLRNQPVPLTFVADRLKTLLVSLQKGMTVNTIFEYLPSNFTSKVDFPIGNTTINQAGSMLNKDSEIYSITRPKADTMVVGGNFTSDTLGKNLFIISTDNDGGFKRVNGDGLNNPVKSLFPLNSDLSLVMGNFTGLANSSEATSSLSQSLNYVAFMNNTDGSFSSLGKGTDGPVTHASVFTVNQTNVVVFDGNFTSVRAANANYSLLDGTLPVWVANESSWIPQSSFNTTFIQGRVTGSGHQGVTKFYTGFLRVLSSLSSGASFTDIHFDLSPMPFKFIEANASDSNIGANSNASSSNSHNTLKKRSLVTSADGNSIYCGAFSNSSLSILGGHFKVEANDLIYKNIIMVDGNQVSGLPNNTIDDSSIFYSLLVSDNVLYAGGHLSGTIENNQVSGLVFYDLSRNAYRSVQPPGLSGGTATVNSIVRQPNSNMLIVAGGFELAGSLTCTSMCMYDLANTRWLSPSPGLRGEVTSMQFMGNDVVLLAGDLSLNNTNVSLASYDFTTRTYSTYGARSSGLPGPISSIVLNGRGLESIFASGIDRTTNEYYIAHWNGGDSWNRIDSQLKPGSQISDLTVLQLQDTHSANSVLPNNQALLMSGNVILNNLGSVSSAMFDGNNITPIFLTANKDGSVGAINSFFSQEQRVFHSSILQKHMKKGFVILIALAISIGLTFIIMVIGLLFAYLRRYKEGYVPANSRVSEMGMADSVPPAELLEEMKNVPGAQPTKGIGSMN